MCSVFRWSTQADRWGRFVVGVSVSLEGEGTWDPGVSGEVVGRSIWISENTSKVRERFPRQSVSKGGPSQLCPCHGPLELASVQGPMKSYRALSKIHGK